jgi:hypothetical protein
MNVLREGAKGAKATKTFVLIFVAFAPFARLREIHLYKLFMEPLRGLYAAGRKFYS